MHEILRHLPEGACVLDLGSRSGSFDPSLYPVRTIRLDVDFPESAVRADFVQADAARLPFRDSAFDAIIANHSLEHFERLPAALEEMRRVVKPDGSLYIAVPDSSTMADRLYRWLASGGGHVNAFCSRPDLIALVESSTGLQLAAGRSLLASLSMLNNRSRVAPAPGKLVLLGGGREGVLLCWSAVSRLLDRWLRTRLSLYGWALYFGTLREEVDGRAWSNVCVRCGCGSSSDWLESCGLVKRRWRLIPGYTCQMCGAWNVFTRDGGYLHLK